MKKGFIHTNVLFADKPLRAVSLPRDLAWSPFWPWSKSWWCGNERVAKKTIRTRKGGGQLMADDPASSSRTGVETLHCNVLTGIYEANNRPLKTHVKLSHLMDKLQASQWIWVKRRINDFPGNPFHLPPCLGWVKNQGRTLCLPVLQTGVNVRLIIL